MSAAACPAEAGRDPWDPPGTDAAAPRSAWTNAAKAQGAAGPPVLLPGPQAAADLIALVEESVATDSRREVLLLRLGGLDPRQRGASAHPAGRLVREALAPLFEGSVRTRLFGLPNGDLVAVAPPPAHPLEAAREALTRVLDATAPPDAIRTLRLPEAAAAVLAAAAESLGLTGAAAGREDPTAWPSSGPSAPGGATAFDSAALAALERTLAAADLGAVTRRQTVCRLDPDHGPAAPLWEDRRPDWTALAAAVLPPGCDPAAAPALRRRLGRLLEARLIAELAHPASLRAWRPTGLAISPETFGGPAFARLDAALPAMSRAGLVLGLRAEDALADPSGFASVRDAARARGYRLALDAATPALLVLLPPARLGVDLVRLRWSPDLTTLSAEARAHALALCPGGPAGVVLAGVAASAALAWGWEAGITMFQGPLIERRRGPH